MHEALIGAALLLTDRPLTAGELAGLLEVRPDEIPARMEAFARHLQSNGIGVLLEQVAGGYRLVVDPKLVPKLSALLRSRPLPRLSPAALEVLALVAYRQPITRAEIEVLRGGPAAALDTLLDRELVEVVGRRAALGRPQLFGTTERFLVDFGLRSLEDLPEPEPAPEFSEILRG